MRYVIIGASAAGCKAAETLRRYAPQSPITVISDEPQPLYSRPLLTYVLSGEVSPEKVWLRGPDYFREWGFNPVLGEPALGVDPSAHAVHLRGGRSLPYDRLLIASGARPRLLGLPGEDLAGVFTLRTLADWQRLAAGLPQEGRVVVVGAGPVGLKAAEALRRRGLAVSLVEAEGQPLPLLVDGTAAGLLQQALKGMDIDLHLDTRPAAVLGANGRVRGVALAGGREIPCRAVLFAIGVTPNVEFLAGTDLAGPDGIPVDHQMGTADPDIYAAGDCAYAFHLLTKKRAGYRIWPAAVAQGRVAGANLAGAGLAYDGLLPQNSLSLRGFHLITGGLGPLDAEGCEVVSQLDERRGHYRSLIYQEGKLVGLTLVGAVEEAGIYFQLMAQQLPIPQPVQPGRMWG
jgi:NADPH-dependent 2,4-dienoyl-CoA reductase/sulfur reductase-like enzyme